ncbi:unnamed protein product [Eruca vesicaria subsp. sativa]|uniref:Jacalin-type lectin domain-containing protein n=1 Tax=Eruca vesicaria subsp. sativa TaxID=29727 RepID=A0ABC8LMK0_ERUVS|nr:unnamed protein product [Eruca vesicaria subsp. sativa]
MTQKLEAQGACLDFDTWDDGSDYDGVSKIYLGCGLYTIHTMYFDYVKSGKSIEGPCRGLLVNNEMVEINLFENEHLVSVNGAYYNRQKDLHSLVFNSNFRTIGPFKKAHVPSGSKEFTLAVKGKKIIGFHGSAANAIYSLGAYFTWITPIRVETKGGKGGEQWDDGYEHEDVSMIQVQGGSGGIQSIQFNYVRSNEEVKQGLLRGVSSGGNTKTYEIKYLQGEYLVSVEGYYDDGTSAIQGLQFRTNTQTFEMMGSAMGRKFTVASNGNKITGFHGYADNTALISIGAYFTTTRCKLECVGGDINIGTSWDDGSGYDGIRKFVIDYPNEFITSVEGSVENGLFRSLTIKTSKGRRSPTYGEFKGSKFVLEKPGNILVGFYGTRCDDSITSLGAYYRPLPPPPVEEKLEEQGGNGGDNWDDGGTFHRIKRIYIGLTENKAIGFVKFMYVQNDDRIVFGDDHGSKTLSDIQEFTIGDPAEYLTSVEGDYDDESGVITMLRFITNKTNSRVFGVGTTSRFVLHKSGYQIVGFHGKSSDMLHQIGVHVLPISV